MSKYNLIIADDDATIGRLLEMKSKHFGFRPVVVTNGEEVIQLVNEAVDVILLDVHMPQMDGLKCLKKLSEIKSKTPVIMLSGELEVSVAVEAVKLGALDYLTKPFDLDELFTALRNARRISKIQRENHELRENLSDSLSTHSSEVNLISESEVTRKLQQKALKVADLDSTVLLTGESGTGKSVFARFIHANSERRDKPFVTVSCPALPRELLESELFGHEKGAFTGALKRRIGKIESAAGGTLFLDEIGDLPLDLQPKLLNVLQDQEFTRVGGTQVIKSDTRLITATNINFKEKIANKEFREDLFYRISVIPLELPPLRKQVENIIPLAEYFLARMVKNEKFSIITLSSEVKQILQSYRWPGNIRQLENMIERSVVFCEDDTIEVDDLPAELHEDSGGASISGLAGLTLAEIEAEAILQTLVYCKNNKAETARTLGITEKSIYNKIKRHGIL